MARIIIFFVTSTLFQASYAQTNTISGKVTYISTVRNSLFIPGAADKIDTTWLFFTDTSSSYVIDTKINVDPRKIAASFEGKNISAEDKKGLVDRTVEFYKKDRYQFTFHQNGTPFISRPWAIGQQRYCRVDTLPDSHWILLPDTMHILGFTCQKAISKSISEGSTTQWSFSAWYTPEIPAIYGPKYIFGLPGLVLMADSKFFHYEAVQIKIPLSPEETVQLSPCKGYPLISAKEAEERTRRIMTDMMNMQKLRTNP
jgi:GLPGLI family protein